MARRFLTYLTLIALTGAVGGCGDGPNGGNAAPSAAAKAFIASHPRVSAAADDSGNPQARFVTVITADKPATLDPQNSENGGDIKIVNQIYETLIRMDPGNVDQLNPELAESWQVSDDGLTITFTLRKGVTFHDGAALDALAAKLSIDRLRGTYLDVPAAPYRGFFDFIDQTEAQGLTLTVRLKRPVARVALRNLSMFPASIISPRLMEATAGMSAGQRSTFISEWASGTGPYYLSSFRPAEARVRLIAFDGYWRGKPAIAKLLFRQVADEKSQRLYLASGEADMLDDVPRPVWDELDADPNVTLHRMWALNVCYLGMNVGHEKTRDPRVRRAIRLAIDRDKLVELYYGSARATYSLIAQPFAEYDPDYRAPNTDDPLAQRQAMARQLLSDAGAVGRAMTIYFPMHPRPYLPTPQKVADKLRQQLNEIGLNIEIVAVPNAELFDSVKHNQYELVLIGWMSDNADADNFYVPLADGDAATGEPAPTNVGRAFDPQVHDLLIKAQSINDAAARITAYRQVEHILQERVVAFVPLVNTQQGYAFARQLKGVEVDPLGYYRFHKARLEESPAPQ